MDGVVTMTSTVGLEGALLGKPFVALNVSVFTPDAPFTEMGIARGVEHLNESEIEEAILDALEGRWKPSAQLPKIGTATQNVIRVIEELLERNSS